MPLLLDSFVLIWETNRKERRVSEKKTELTNVELHKEVVAGVVQVILFARTSVTNQPKSQNLPRKALAVGALGRAKEAYAYILEFILEGKLRGLPTAVIYEVIEGDYRNIWASVNNYLKLFGYAPIVPVEIKTNP